jgi:hypothetical protein
MSTLKAELEKTGAVAIPFAPCLNGAGSPKKTFATERAANDFCLLMQKRFPNQSVQHPYVCRNIACPGFQQWHATSRNGETVASIPSPRPSRGETTKRVEDGIARGLSRIEIARELDLTTAAIDYQIRKIKKAGDSTAATLLSKLLSRQEATKPELTLAQALRDGLFEIANAIRESKCS